MTAEHFGGSVTWLVPRETVAVSAHVLCTPYNHAPVYKVTSLIRSRDNTSATDAGGGGRRRGLAF